MAANSRQHLYHANKEAAGTPKENAIYPSDAKPTL
jgi:hypothetical protein